MASVNKVILVGNLGRDLETHKLANGETVANISIATTEAWKDKNGSKQENTEWHRISVYGRLAEIAGEHLKKGSQVYIEGRLQTRKWTDKSGQDKYATEIIASEMKMLGSASDRKPVVEIGPLDEVTNFPDPTGIAKSSKTPDEEDYPF